MKKKPNDSIWHLKAFAILFLCIIFAMGTMPVYKAFPTLKQTVADAVPNNIDTLGENIEAAINENFALKTAYIEINALEQNLLNKKIVEDAGTTVVKDSDGYLHIPVDVADVTVPARNVTALYQSLQQMEIPFIYAFAPYKSDSRYEELPIGIKDGARENRLAFLSLLDENEVPYVDLSEQSIEHFKTDHHWTIESAYTASKYLMRALNEAGVASVFDETIANDGEYSFQTTEDVFLGSQGRRTGLLYAGMDDFTYILPNFETNLRFSHFVNGDLQLQKEGSFSEALISEPAVTGYAPDYYATYMNGCYCEIIIENRLSRNDDKLLIIGDSYGRTFGAYASLYFAETRILDTQKGRFNDPLTPYIESYRPDAVIMLYVGDELNHPEVFDFERHGQ